MIREHCDDEVTQLYNPALLPRPTPPPTRAERATIPDLEEEVTDDALLIGDEPPRYVFVKRTCVLDEAEIELARASTPSSSLFVPTPRAVVPTVLSEHVAQANVRRSNALATVTKIAVLAASACIGGMLSYRFDLGPHALEWIRYALEL